MIPFHSLVSFEFDSVWEWIKTNKKKINECKQPADLTKKWKEFKKWIVQIIGVCTSFCLVLFCRVTFEFKRAAERKALRFSQRKEINSVCLNRILEVNLRQIELSPWLRFLTRVQFFFPFFFAFFVFFAIFFFFSSIFFSLKKFCCLKT